MNESTRDLRVESWLHAHGAHDFHLRENVALDLINERRSRSNNARRNEIMTDLAERYAADMRDGASFPPLIGYESRSGVVLIDGNHRHEGAKLAAVDRFAIYIVDAEVELVARLTTLANMLNGEPLTIEERVDHAVAATAVGSTLVAAARDYGVTLELIRTTTRYRKVVERARHLGATAPGSLPPYVHSFAAIKLDAAFVACCVAARVRKNATLKQCRELASAVNKASSESEALACVEQWTRATRALRPGNDTARSWNAVARGLVKVEVGLLDPTLVDQIPRDAYAEIADRLFEVAALLLKVADELTSAAAS